MGVERAILSCLIDDGYTADGDEIGSTQRLMLNDLVLQVENQRRQVSKLTRLFAQDGCMERCCTGTCGHVADHETVAEL